MKSELADQFTTITSESGLVYLYALRVMINIVIITIMAKKKGEVSCGK